MKDIHRYCLKNDPIVFFGSVQGSKLVHVAHNELRGNLMVNLIIMAGAHQEKNVYQFYVLPSLYPISLNVILKEKSKKVKLQPEGRQLKYTYSEGKMNVEILNLEIHPIIEIQSN